MKAFSKSSKFVGLTIVICTMFLFAGVASALEIVLEPDNAQREIGGKVRVHIYADGAVNLISMGVKVSFDPAVLQVPTAEKNDEDAGTGWVMADGEGGEYRTPDVEIDNAAGTVTMIGGNINGTSTTGHSGKVFLGWIVFEAIAEGNSDLNIDLAKYHPNHDTDTFDNFVNVGGTVDEPTNLGNLGIICVRSDAVVGDINGNNFVEPGDYAILRSGMNKVFPDSEYNNLADLNGNGVVEPGDYAILRSNMNTPLPSCP